MSTPFAAVPSVGPMPGAARGVLRLPFTINPVNTREHLRDVLRLRHAAYSRHDYTARLKEALLRPDESDLSGVSTTFVAVCKTTRKLLGTLRVQSSLDGPVDWPDGTPDDECREGAYTYIDRFAVAPASGDDQALALSGLIKAAYLWSLSRDSYFATALARPALARIYRRRGGMTIRGNGQKVRMPDYHDEEYHLLGTPLHEVRGRLETENRPYHDQFFNKAHPDIALNAMSIPWDAVGKPELALVHG